MVSLRPAYRFALLSPVQAWSWRPKARRLVCLGTLGGAGTASPQALAVVRTSPAAAVAAGGAQATFLVAATQGSRDMRVLSLPPPASATAPTAARPVLVHRLDAAVRVSGLAADPTGAALAVSDARSGRVLVLPWPLPGMV